MILAPLSCLLKMNIIIICALVATRNTMWSIQFPLSRNSFWSRAADGSSSTFSDRFLAVVIIISDCIACVIGFSEGREKTGNQRLMRNLNKTIDVESSNARNWIVIEWKLKTSNYSLDTRRANCPISRQECVLYMGAIPIIPELRDRRQKKKFVILSWEMLVQQRSTKCLLNNCFVARLRRGLKRRRKFR